MAEVVSYFCERCQKTLGESETKRIAAGTGFVLACPTCGGLARKETSQIAARASRPLAIEMLLAYGFPFRPSSLIALVPMALVIAISCWSIRGVLLGVICWAVMLAMMFATVRSTAAGDDRITVDSIYLDRGEVSDARPFIALVSQVVSLFAFATVARICGILLREEL